MDVSFDSPSLCGKVSKLDSTSPGSYYLPPFLLGNDRQVKNNEQNTSLFGSFSEYNTLSPKIGNSNRKSAVSLLDYETKEIPSPIGNNSAIESLKNDTYTDINRSFCSHPGGYSNMWVTVYGFTPSVLPMVLSYFSEYGNIIETRYSEHGGNWVHIRYSSRTEVNNALSRHGKKIKPNLMIGVMVCHEPGVLNESKLSRTLNNTSISLQGSVNDLTPVLPVRFLNDSPNLNTTTTSQTSTGKTNSFGQTLQYFFGW